MHELLLFHRNRKRLVRAFQMQSEYVETRTAVVAFYCDRSGLVLYGEIIADGTRPVPYEVVRLREASAFDEIVKKVVES